MFAKKISSVMRICWKIPVVIQIVTASRGGTVLIFQSSYPSALQGRHKVPHLNNTGPPHIRPNHSLGYMWNLDWALQKVIQQHQSLSKEDTYMPTHEIHHDWQTTELPRYVDRSCQFGQIWNMCKMGCLAIQPCKLVFFPGPELQWHWEQTLLQKDKRWPNQVVDSKFIGVIHCWNNQVCRP